MPTKTETSEKTFAPQELMEKMGDEVTMQLPAWAQEVAGDIQGFISKVLGSRSYPFSISPKNLRAAISALGGEAFHSVMQMVKEPADLFYVPYGDYMEKIYQGIIDYGVDFTADKIRGKFGEYEGMLKEKFTALSKGKGYAVSEMQAMFRDSLKSINSQFQNQLSIINRLSISDPRLRKSSLIDLEIAKGGWVQTTRDRVMVKEADMRLKSEFFGVEGLLNLAVAATNVETTATKMEMAAKGISLEGLKGLKDLGTQEMAMVEANQNIKQRNLQNLLGVLGAGQKIWEYGTDYPLRAATGAMPFVGTGYNFALGQYTSDIGRYRGSSETYPGESSMGPAIGGLWGMGVGGALGFAMGGPLGVLPGIGVGGTAGALGGSLFD